MDANLVLRFDVGDREPKRVDLGNDNTYIITGALTRSIRLRIQVAFERNGRQIRASVYQPYTLDESLSDGGAPIEPLPTPALTRLIAGAFVKAGYSGNVLSFSNLAGETVDQVTIIGGGGTGSGNVSSGQIMSIWVGSLADYETMAKDDETLYFIEG